MALAILRSKVIKLLVWPKQTRLRPPEPLWQAVRESSTRCHSRAALRHETQLLTSQRNHAHTAPSVTHQKSLIFSLFLTQAGCPPPFPAPSTPPAAGETPLPQPLPRQARGPFTALQQRRPGPSARRGSAAAR